MPIQVEERHNFERGSVDSREFFYVIHGAADVTEALASVPGDALRNFPVEGYGEMPFVKTPTAELVVDAPDPEDRVWIGSARYELPSVGTPTDDVPDFSIGISTQTVNRNRSIGPQITYDATHNGTVNPDIGLVIGKNGEGVDVTLAQPTLTLRKRYNQFSWRLKARQIAPLVGRTNSDTFFDFPPESLLFVGANPTDSGRNVLVEYQFFVQEPETETIDIKGIGPTQITKPGWRYLWVWQDETNEQRNVEVKSAHVARTFFSTPFASLL